MPAATKTTSTRDPAITQANLGDAIKTAFTQAGFGTAFDDYTSGDRLIVYRLIFDAAKTFGTAYLRIKITTGLVITQQLYTGWNASTHLGTGGSFETTGVTYSSGSQISFTGLEQASEYRFVLMLQGTTYQVLGYLRPANKPSWWDENTYLFCFFPSTTSFSSWYGPSATPYWTSSTSSNFYSSNLGTSAMSAANPINSKRDVLGGLILYPSSTSQGVAARSSDDIVQVAATGLARFDSIQVTQGSDEYILLNPSTGGMAVRTV